MSWHKVKLKTLLSQPVQNGYSPVCPEEPNGKWILGLGALSDFGLDTTQIKPAPVDDSKVDNFLLRPGDFLVSRSNTRDKVGRSALFKGEIKNCSYPDLMMRFRINETTIYPEFLEMYLRSHRTVKYFQRSASGTSGTMVKINKRVVENLKVPLPPMPEQTAIAALLSTWDAAIEKTEKLIAAKEKQMNALYQLFFQPGMSANSSWHSTKIGQFMTPRKEREVPSEEIPLFSLTIEDGVTPKTDRYNRDFLVKDNGSKTYEVVYPGDIVFNPSNLRWGAIARSHVEHKVVISPIYEILKIKTDKIDPAFLEHALTCPRQIGIFATRTEGTLIERMAVKLDAFLLTEIMVPPTIDEQQKVASFLDMARDEIKLLKSQVVAYRKQKRGLMQKLLTGQWRVNHVEACNGP